MDNTSATRVLKDEVESVRRLCEFELEVENLKVGEASLAKRCGELLSMEVKLRTELSELKECSGERVFELNKRLEFAEEKRVENHEAWLSEMRRAEDAWTCVQHINAIALTLASPSALPVAMRDANKAIDAGHLEIAALTCLSASICNESLVYE